MPAARRRNLLRGRRRLQDEGEEDEIELGDESRSEGSASTGAEDHSDAGESDLSDNDDGAPPAPMEILTEEESTTETNAKEEVRVAGPITAAESPAVGKSPASAFPATADTLVMLNGFKQDKNEGSPAVMEFEGVPSRPEDPQQHGEAAQSVKAMEDSKHETVFQRRAREREEYELKKETDPAFVPNRGGFFMHDQRETFLAQSRFAPFGRGRGRGGRDFAAESRLPFRFGNPSTEVNIGRWDHDLHETVNKPSLAPGQKHIAQPFPPLPAGQHPEPQRLSPLSKTTSVGTVMVRCSLPSSERPAKFVKMTVRQHTRLPDLRPPLRRDKPVRVALPDRSPRYIFPSVEKSFIFIPRGQRPNQHASKARIRSVFSSSGSRRTSAYGGSVYEPSIGMSRRSSGVPDMMLFPEPNAFPGQAFAGPQDMARPVVRLPSNAHLYQTSGSALLGTAGISQYARPDAPIEPLPAGSIAAQLPMHQPRPQKTVSLATIESTDRGPLLAPEQQEQQPFYHQVPAHMTRQMSMDRPDGVSGPQFSMPDQMPMSNPAPNIPEASINAEPFQPSHMGQQALYPSPYANSQPLYYYNMAHDGQPDHYGTDNMNPSVYLQQGPYLVPMFVPPAMSAEDAAAASQAGMYAQERNGMVYYYDSVQLGPNAEGPSNMSYSVPEAGSMMTPGPEGYYYTQAPPGMVYYPSQ